jgi:TusA-related sulfurtransferase
MGEVGPGEVLLVLATDPEAAVDLAAFAADAGHGFEERPGRGWTEFVLTRAR